MITTIPRRGLVVAALALIGAAQVSAETHAQQQQPILGEVPNLGPTPGSMEPKLGPSPGAMAPSTFTAQDLGVIGGRARGGSGRVPRRVGSIRTTRDAPTGAARLGTPTVAPADDGPTRPSASATALDTTAALDDEGAPDGLTLDAAVERLLSSNLDLLALRHEFPQARADLLTAGLRANPLIYGDTQFIPFGTFNNARPGGPTQYDVNITYPIDLSGKRQARVRVARAAMTGLEAQFQDAVRRQIGTLSRAFVDLQAARVDVLSAEAGFREQERLANQANKPRSADDAERLTGELDKARTALDDARSSLDDAREVLGLLLNLTPEQAARLDPRGGLKAGAPEAPPLDDLIRIALSCRPDLNAGRRGIGRAEAEIGLAKANRFDDVYLFYDPYTYQDNRPSHAASARSWGVGLTVPLPIYNRNQGNIARAHANLSQTRVELTALERRVVTEVRLAEREYRNARDAVPRIERSTLPRARKDRLKAVAEFSAGSIGVNTYLDRLSDDADSARAYRDACVRRRRGALDLNTAVGVRLLP